MITSMLDFQTSDNFIFFATSIGSVADRTVIGHFHIFSSLPKISVLNSFFLFGFSIFKNIADFFEAMDAYSEKERYPIYIGNSDSRVTSPSDIFLYLLHNGHHQ